jgi:hypothetical protein
LFVFILVAFDYRKDGVGGNRREKKGDERKNQPDERGFLRDE